MSQIPISYATLYWFPKSKKAVWENNSRHRMKEIIFSYQEWPKRFQDRPFLPPFLVLRGTLHKPQEKPLNLENTEPVLCWSCKHKCAFQAPGGLLIAWPHPQSFWLCKSELEAEGMGRSGHRICISKSSQEMLLLVRGPRFVNHWPRVWIIAA